MSERVIDLLSQLIRFDTSNWGGGRANGETDCARWVGELLTAVGYSPLLIARDDSPERGNLIVRVAGREPELPGLLVQGHLDVVPVDAAEWSVDPFAGVVAEGYVWGRGSTDMKDLCASMIAVLLEWAEEGYTPRRTMVFAFLADEEAGSEYGAEFLVDAHPDLFAGLGAAIGEDGAIGALAEASDGSPVHLYAIACGERGTSQLRITGRGVGGHGSRPSGDDAISRALAATNRLASHEWPLHISKLVGAQLSASAAALKMTVDLSDEASIRAVIDQLGPSAGALRWTIRTSATPTVLKAGYKVNVIPSTAEVEFDVRVPPGAKESTDAALAELIGDDVEWEFLNSTEPLETDHDNEWFRAMSAAVLAVDPQAAVVPYCMGGGTDAKAFARLGLATYGFSPLTIDPDGRVPQNYHAKDERNPVASIVGGHEILRRFLMEL